jgi:DNA polymerase III delta subunit
MLYVYHGSEINKSLKKARTLADSLRAKRPDATYIEVDGDSWSSSVIEENVGGQGLFSNKYIVFLNRVTENKDAKEVLPDMVEIMNESENIFILLEGKLNADLKKSVEKFAEKVVETQESDVGNSKFREKGGKKEDFNIFALADAVGSRNALTSWTLYRQAIDSGQEVESIIGMIFWKIKSMITTKNTKSYSERELKDLLTDLITIYHDGHRGVVDAQLEVEKLMLGLRGKN